MMRSVRSLPSGTVTFLFTDIEGSTRLLHQLGAEAYSGALAKHRRVLREAFERHGGVEVDTQGDAFFVAFPTAPGALEAAAEARQDWPRVRSGCGWGSTPAPRTSARRATSVSTCTAPPASPPAATAGFGDAWGTAHALCWLGRAVADEGAFARARELFEESARSFHEVGDESYALLSTRFLAWMYYELGDRDRARAQHENNLRRAREMGDRNLEATTLGALAAYAVEEARVEDAVAVALALDALEAAAP